MTTTTVETPKMAAVRSTVLLGDFKLSIEHGWLCVRTGTGWLLLDRKISEIPLHGISLDEIETEVRKCLPVCDCGREQHGDHCKLVELGLIPATDDESTNNQAELTAAKKIWRKTFKHVASPAERRVKSPLDL